MAVRRPAVIVIGPAYVDLAVKCQTVPAPGEVVDGSSFTSTPTGAGVNRAIQAALCGCEVSLIARVGDDSFGQMIQKTLQQYNISTDLIYTANAMNTGIIVTLVDSQGEDGVCMCAGANRTFGRNEIEYAAAEQAIGMCDSCLICGELPQETIVSAIRTASVIHKRRVVLESCLPTYNRDVLRQIQWPMEYYNVDTLVVRFADFTCASELSSGGTAELKFIGTELVARGANCVVISLGWRGALVIDRQGARHIPGLGLDVVDNCCTMDAFCGALAACCGTKDSADMAVRFAVAAEALARSRFGTQDSLPKKEDIITVLQQQPD